MVNIPEQRQSRFPVFAVVAFTVILVGGLFLVKWSPYFHKAFTIADMGMMGSSIITGGANAAPAFSWNAAWQYAVVYGKAIWEALAVGLLVGAGVQALLPRDWLLRVLGKTGFKSAAVAGLASVPGMM